MRKIYENIAYAKSILNRRGIKPDSKEWEDYLKIREICGINHGYIGILTRIRFVDNITDMDEISSIFDILKSSKIDIGKLNKMSYDDILNTFYDQLSGDKDDKNYELIFKDDEYSYFKVYTYEGILEIGSPSWCLKTKSNWDKYQEVFGEQWVVINNKYIKKIISPNNFYLREYKNVYGWVRFGISLKTTDDTVNFKAFNDNNQECNINTSEHTFYGVICTIFNLVKGVKKSYYDKFMGCVKYNEYWHKITDLDKFFGRIDFKDNMYFKDIKDWKWDTFYAKFSYSYSYHPVGLFLSQNLPVGVHFINHPNKNFDPCILSTDKSKNILNDYAINSKSKIYSGIKLKLGLLNIEQIKEIKGFVDIVGDYVIFDHNSEHYSVVNINLKKDYILPTTCMNTYFNFSYDNILYWYLNKKDMLPSGMKRSELKQYHKDVINYFKKNTVKKFWDFRK